MTSIKSFLELLRAHLWPLVAFFAMALLVAGPVFAFPSWAGNAYHGINMPTFGNDVHQYYSRANEALAGNGLGNPYLAMNKGESDPTSSFVEKTLVMPLRLFGFTDPSGLAPYLNFLNFIGVFAMLVLMYAFALELSENKLIAAAGALFAVGGYSIIYHKWIFYTDFNTYGRSVYPYVSSIPFFALLFTSYRAIVRKMHYGYLIAASLLFGVLWYDYFFAWSYALAALGSIGLVYLLCRNWGAVWRTAVIGVSGVILGIPAFLSAIKFLSETGEQIAYFYFTSATHAPVMSLVGAATLLLIAIFAYVQRNDPATPFMLGLIIAGWIALNQQVITGRDADYGHYYWYFIVPVAIIISLYMVWRLTPKKWQTWLACLAIATAFTNTMGGQYQSFFMTTDVKLHENLYGPILSELDTLPGGIVFMSPISKTYSYLVTIYTNDDLYFSRGALLYHTPLPRVKDTLLISLYLNKNSRSDPRAFLEEDVANNFDDPYTQLFGYLEGADSGLSVAAYDAETVHPDTEFLKKRSELFDSLEAEYEKSYSTGSKVADALRAGNVSYFIWDKLLAPEWEPAIPGLSVMDDRGDIVLYSFK
jgi:hypothetical protein